MSIRVKIDVLQRGGSVAHRWLHIDRVTNLGDDTDQDLVSEYSVSSGNFPIEQAQARIRIATFEHRYGDDLGILVGKAAEAIRAEHGTF